MLLHLSPVETPKNNQQRAMSEGTINTSSDAQGTINTSSDA